MKVETDSGMIPSLPNLSDGLIDFSTIVVISEPGATVRLKLNTTIGVIYLSIKIRDC